MDNKTSSGKPIVFATPACVVGKHEWRCIVYHDPKWSGVEKNSTGFSIVTGPRNFSDWEWRSLGESPWRARHDWPKYDSHDSFDGLPKTLQTIWNKHEVEINAAVQSNSLVFTVRALKQSKLFDMGM